MYSLADIAEGIKRPRRALVELNRIYDRTVNGIERTVFPDKDWDNLIILDACRYDLFEEKNTIDGELTSVFSPGSTTGEFLKQNFAGDTFPDTVYVSANPQLQIHNISRLFHDSLHLWEDYWHPDLHTVTPDVVTDHTINFHNQHPNKRLIVHYVQPHFPFIGETGQEITHAGFAESPGNLRETEPKPIWDRLKDGEISKDRVWRAYAETLELALPEVDRLLSHLPGKSVVTADHGNAFGEWGYYGHPGGIYLDCLVKVPWLVVDSDDRKTITDGDVSPEEGETDSDQVTDRLQDLGYLDT